MKPNRRSKFFKLFSGLALLTLALPALASDDPAFTLIAYSNAPGGEALLAGDYDTAISIAKPQRRRVGMRLFAETNLCVSYTITGMQDEAEAACGKAIKLASSSSSSVWTSIGETRARRALAYSNRGVMRAVTGDQEGAREDLSKAQRIDAERPAYAQNLARLEADNAAESVARLEYR